MVNIKPLETFYNGYRFRSRLEARWAIFFDALGIEYEYEPEGINEDGTYYLPDFYLPTFSSYFEVKRKGLSDKEKSIAISKISYGAYSESFSGMIAFGDPVDDDITIFCQESDDGGGGSYENSVTIGIHPTKKIPWLFAYDDHRERSFLTCWSENYEDIDMSTTENGTYRYEDFVNNRVINARLKARQARFEHGETF